MISSESETASQGGVNYYSMTSNDKTKSQTSSESERVTDFSEEDVDKLKNSVVQNGGLYQKMQMLKTLKEWKAVKANQSLGYNEEYAVESTEGMQRKGTVREIQSFVSALI